MRDSNADLCHRADVLALFEKQYPPSIKHAGDDSLQMLVFTPFGNLIN
jgi:hypothetical protein